VPIESSNSGARQNRRRRLVLAGSALPFALHARAQQGPATRRIGFLATGIGSQELQVSIDGFRQRMREHGYVEGRNLRIEYRDAEGKLDRLPALAAELASLKVELIVAMATPSARAAQQATRTIPIVAHAMGDPVADGLVASLPRPGGNLTGTTFLGPKLVPKHLELVKEILPRASQVTILRHPGAFAESTMAEMLKETHAAAEVLRIRLHFTDVRGAHELDQAFARIRPDQAQAFVVFPSPLLFFERTKIVALCAKHRLPAVFNNSQAVELGGLAAYGTSLGDLARESANYVVRILKGARPADLPVQQPAKFELAVNLRTAKTLGITLPQSILVRADKVIE
jgi:putative ABC transport system substrate-binding protein